MLTSYLDALWSVLVGLELMKSFVAGVHALLPVCQDVSVMRFNASCEIICGDVKGIRDQLGSMGVMITGSSLMSGLSLRDLLSCLALSAATIGGTMPGVFALVIL